ncbi:hypothetical protein N9B51_00005, partial [bacterium]|nr:hypothetical protein [bacterium]
LEDESFAFAQGNNLFHAVGVGLVFIGHSLRARIFPRGPRGNRRNAAGESFFERPTKGMSP